MFKTIICDILLLFISATLKTSAFPNYYPKIKQEIMQNQFDPGLPLILTPLIKQHKIKEAVSASAVQFREFHNIQSYSGYFTVDKVHNSNLFFWFFPSESISEDEPVVLWLQGGPGASSLIGLFTENGPITVNDNGKVRRRKYSWSSKHHVIYIDSPVGTGYSFTDETGYARNETKVGEDLYEALRQFFTLFPKLSKNEFYVAGESYGGKYAPAIAYTIHNKNPSAKMRINLKGIAMGNGYSDPVNQLNYGTYLYQIGLVDLNTKEEMKVYEQKIVDLVKIGDFEVAEDVMDSLMDGDFKNGSLFRNATGFQNYYNYFYNVDPLDEEMENFGKFIQRTDVRAAIHVGNATFHGEDQTVEVNLKSDIMQSVAPWISELLSNYRVLIYNGQLDIIVAYPLTVNYLQNLKFSGADEYKTAKRYQWYVDQELAGYVKQAGNLTEILVRDAGHMVPADQPKWAFDLISRFTRNKPYHIEENMIY